MAPMTLKLQLALGLLILLPAFSSAAPAPEDAFGVNQALSPGLNYGAIFDAKPPEGWGLLAKEGDFKIMAAAGFKSVRLPVRWSAKAAESEPYALDPLFLARVDSMVQAARVGTSRLGSAFESPTAISFDASSG